MKLMLRVRGLATAIVAFVALIGGPSVTSQAHAATVATESLSLTAIPALPTVAVPQPTLAQPLSPIATAAPAVAPAIASNISGTVTAQRPLRDLVVSFVDYGNQDAEQECLASAVYFEARGETLEGQLAVAEVVLNRAASGKYPPTICSVVTQPAQFSFVRRGKFPPIDRASNCWHKAKAIADIARKRLAQQVAPNVLWYHANYVAPNWGRRLTKVAQIGSHIFYN